MNYIEKIVNFIIRPHRDQYRIKKLGDPQIKIHNDNNQIIHAHREDRIILNKNNQHLHLSYYEIVRVEKGEGNSGQKIRQQENFSNMHSMVNSNSSPVRNQTNPYSKQPIQPFQHYYNDSNNKLPKNNFVWFSNAYHNQTQQQFNQKKNQSATSLNKLKNPKNKCVIYLHANNGSRLEGMFYLQSLLKANCNVCLFDCSGSGNSDGSYVTLGLKEARDLDSVVNFLVKEKKVEEIALWGRSMGASTALIYASRILAVKISCIVLDSPFKDLEKLIKQIASDKTGLPKVFFNPLIPFIRNQIIKKTGYNIEDLKLKKYIQKGKKQQKAVPISQADILSSQTQQHTKYVRNINPFYQIPALFIVSQKDKFVRCHHGQKLFKRYPCINKQLFYIDIQHHQSRQDRVVNKIINFIVLNFQQNDKKHSNLQNNTNFNLTFSKQPHTKSGSKSRRNIQQDHSKYNTTRQKNYQSNIADGGKQNPHLSLSGHEEYLNNGKRNENNQKQVSRISLGSQRSLGPIQKLKKNIQVLCNNQKKTLMSENKNSIEVRHPNEGVWMKEGDENRGYRNGSYIENGYVNNAQKLNSNQITNNNSFQVSPNLSYPSLSNFNSNFRNPDLINQNSMQILHPNTPSSNSYQNYKPTVFPSSNYQLQNNLSQNNIKFINQNNESIFRDLYKQKNSYKDNGNRLYSEASQIQVVSKAPLQNKKQKISLSSTLFMNEQQQQQKRLNGNQGYINNQFNVNTSTANKSFHYSSNPNSRINIGQFQNNNSKDQPVNSSKFYNSNQIGQNGNPNQSFYAPKNEFKFSYFNNNQALFKNQKQSSNHVPFTPINLNNDQQKNRRFSLNPKLQQSIYNHSLSSFANIKNQPTTTAITPTPTLTNFYSPTLQKNTSNQNLFSEFSQFSYKNIKQNSFINNPNGQKMDEFKHKYNPYNSIHVSGTKAQLSPTPMKKLQNLSNKKFNSTHTSLIFENNSNSDFKNKLNNNSFYNPNGLENMISDMNLRTNPTSPLNNKNQQMYFKPIELKNQGSSNYTNVNFMV